MGSGVFAILGGLGLFLLGMAVLTDGLKALAGDALRGVLSRFTTNPLSGVATGALSTAIVQSSSMTMIMAVGFVGAGLLSFPQALGILFGASLGTTVTGWLVLLLGLKLKIDNFVLPLIIVGALLRLFGRKRPAALGFALAGFGLVFAGIATLQGGLQAYQEIITPASFPSPTLGGRVLLVLIGAAITVLTQSSSAAVAAALTAVHVGNISLPQAATMVIGMNVGTTVTTFLAGIGGTANTRRTAVAHVIYSLLTGSGAFLLLPLYLLGWRAVAPQLAGPEPGVAVVAFHTLFNALGVAVVLPFTRQFASFIVRLVPSHDEWLTRRLDPSLLGQPEMAIGSARAMLLDLTQFAGASLAELIGKAPDIRLPLQRLEKAGEAAVAARDYLGQVRATPPESEAYHHRVAAFHLLDHLARLIARCQKTDRVWTVRTRPEMAEACRQLADAVLRDLSDPEQLAESERRLEALYQQLEREMEPYRRRTLEETAASELEIDQAIARIDAFRWLRRVSYHAWRIVHHLRSRPPTQETFADRQRQREAEEIDD